VSVTQKAILLLVLLPAIFLAWRFIRPLNIFVVTEAFELPEDTPDIPQPLVGLGARECAACHRHRRPQCAIGRTATHR